MVGFRPLFAVVRPVFEREDALSMSFRIAAALGAAWLAVGSLAGAAWAHDGHDHGAAAQDHEHGVAVHDRPAVPPRTGGAPLRPGGAPPLRPALPRTDEGTAARAAKDAPGRHGAYYGGRSAFDKR